MAKATILLLLKIYPNMIFLVRIKLFITLPLDSAYDNTLSRKLGLSTADILYNNDSLLFDKSDPA